MSGSGGNTIERRIKNLSDSNREALAASWSQWLNVVAEMTTAWAFDADYMGWHKRVVTQIQQQYGAGEMTQVWADYDVFKMRAAVAAR